MTPSQITDDHRLTGAATRFDSPIPTYDDGQGPLFIHRDSMGISGIVRAATWEDAYSICEDEFFPSADQDAFEKDYEEMTDHEKACWDEAYGYRPNGLQKAHEPTSYVYAKDLNGASLDTLTDALMAELEITITGELWE